MKEKIRGIIDTIMRENSLPNVSDIKDDSSLYSVGVDSINVIEIVIALEENFGIEFNEADLNMDNFDTINSIYEICYTLVNK